jgi:Xaa-Pro aminopeptidase
MGKASIDSFLVTEAANVSYLSGFRGTDAVMLVTADSGYLLADSRFIEEAENEVSRELEVRLVARSTFASIGELATSERIGRMGFESMNLPYGVAQRLKGLLRRTKLVPVKNLTETLRSVKDAAEIGCIKKAVAIARKVFDETSGMIRPGASEAAIKRAMETGFINAGSSAAFEPIVASGANSSRPHARATGRVIAKDDFVMIDIGAKRDGYNSDFTRTITIGRVKDKFKKIYRTVGDAQKAAIDRIKAGAKASDVDKAGRAHIAKKGFAKYFGHSLGHGIGLEVHEEPSISPSSEARLSAGMVFTVEPAIYIPGFGGVRIEDMALVTKNGCEILTR